ncbi:putative O-methyltransferase YrrM [Pontibacter aydingkolensis]|uniref:Class I SAM-dependent methyltransferase n=1 Tax=Pontibacter aydingkolensis TaxID=1911536 RepID=A0ABS7CTQ1_9BACT|nr:class I SAM-dependent methyltransferase [Pontibacter aydingkolensis]MBW7467198.1 class I SAM-dependent methyltransferase [Pontibacter aydingkolensis]
MNRHLEKVFETKEFINENGEIIPIHSETSKDQCAFLQQIIKENKFSKSIEIGFAYGLSTLAITEEVTNNNGSHLVIDKFQNSSWGGNGLSLIEKAGLRDRLEFYESYCYEALPKLLAEGRKFDFAYVDTTKQFDWILVDFFYLDKLLELNGVIVFDDAFYPGIRKALRYISQFPSYKIYSHYPQNRESSFTKKIASYLRHIPKANHLIKDNLIQLDEELSINASCVAIQKIDNDIRNWDWHVDF